MEDEQLSDQTIKLPSSQRSSSEDTFTQKQPQVLMLGGFGALPGGDVLMFPVVYPAFIPGLHIMQNPEQMNRGAGVYAVPVHTSMGPIVGFTPNVLIPFTYSVPTRQNTSGAPSTGEGTGQVGLQQQNQQPQQAGPQRQVVVRRLQIAIHLDLLLILKLAAIIFLFNQDGSRQRLGLLVFFAALVYLYQTGALTPLIRWLSQGMQRAARPPQPPRPPARADNGNENPARAEGRVEEENENEGNYGNRGVENEEEAGAGNRWWGIVKEVKLFVFGFITSLLPGFHNVD